METMISAALFDSDFYARANPDVPASDSQLAHYAQYGALEGRAPHVLFSPQFYLSQLNPMERLRVREPILHYIRYGSRFGMSPSPFFDVKYYVDQVARTELSNLTPLEHYVMIGRKKGLSPNPDFDPEFYSQVSGIDVAQVDPLVDFLTRGWVLGFSPSKARSSVAFVFEHTRFGMFEINAPSQFLPPSFRGSKSTPPLRLLFMHIPKTAGVSLREVVKSQYAVGQAAFIHSFIAGSSDLTSEVFNDLGTRRESLNAVHGHFGYGIHRFFSTPSKIWQNTWGGHLIGYRNSMCLKRIAS